MPTLGLEGPWQLNAETIDDNFTKVSPGNYALGEINGKGAFVVSRVGRSDEDLNGRLHQHIGSYSHFKASYASSKKAAFEKECNNWHDFEPPDNKIHPDRPSGMSWSCPRCTIFD